MDSVILERIEADINQLSLVDQMLLMERLAHRIRETHQRRMFESSLNAMANDPDIQRELREIEAEFLETESDGLDDL